MLKEMQTHPVKPASQIFRVELEQDNAQWQAILQEETSIDGIYNHIFFDTYDTQSIRCNGEKVRDKL